MNKFALGLAFAALATPAFADLSYTKVEADVSYNSIDGDSYNQYGASVAFGGTVNALSYDVELSGVSYEGEFTIADLTVLLGYNVGGGFTLLGGANVMDFDGSDSSYLVLGGEYATGAYTFGAAYLYNTDAKDGSVQAYVDYDNGEYNGYATVLHDSGDSVFVVGFERDTATYDASFEYTNYFGELGIAQIDGSYNIGSNMRLNAGLKYYDFDGANGVGATFGAGYMIADNVWVDLDASRTDIEGVKFDSVGLKVSFETGARALKSAERAWTAMDIFDDIAVAAAD